MAYAADGPKLQADKHQRVEQPRRELARGGVPPRLASCPVDRRRIAQAACPRSWSPNDPWRWRSGCPANAPAPSRRSRGTVAKLPTGSSGPTRPTKLPTGSRRTSDSVGPSGRRPGDQDDREKPHSRGDGRRRPPRVLGVMPRSRLLSAANGCLLVKALETPGAAP